jgi:ABC-type sugar transport system ATPase subunit
MLAMARALVCEHQVLILDETTASATESYFRLVQEVVAQEKAQGRTVVFVSHRMQEVFGMADRIVVLRNGRHVGERQVAETNPDEITELMIGQSLAALEPPRRDGALGDQPVLEVTGLSAGSARDISFQVEPGTVFGIYGLVGSGRSSIARCLAGRQPKLAGQVAVLGKDANPRSPGEALRLGIAYLTEDRHRDGFVPDFTNRENLTLCCSSRYAKGGWISKRRENALAADLVERFTITGGTETMTSSLSGGNQQKVCVARAIAAQPDVYLLDEPTKGVDVGARARIYEIIFALAREGKAVVVISSEADEIMTLASRVMVMRGGQAALLADAAGLTAETLARTALAERKDAQ